MIKINKRQYFNYKFLFFSLLFAVCLLSLSCETPQEAEANPGYVRGLGFSHASGLYPSWFQLILTAGEGAKIYYSIDGSVPSPEKAAKGGPVYQYSSPIRVWNRNGQPNLLATMQNIPMMYMHPFDPRGNVPQVFYPDDNGVPKAAIIRAIAVDSGGSQSDEAILTYFFGGNLANYAGHPVISLVTDPYNLIDQNYGIYVRGAEANRWPNYNFNRSGDAWERPAYLQLFDVKRKVSLSTMVGIRIRGAYSRDRGQKSFNVYFREEHGGINNLKNYNLIPGAVQSNGQPVATYKSFMLRNGGNDTEINKLRDLYIQSLLTDRNFTTQAGVPCIVFINGEYWGPYNLQERYSDNHIEYKYGVNRNNVISFDNGQLDDGVEADMALYENAMKFRNMDMSIKANYDEFCELFDLQGFIDYWAAQIYIYNEDWPHNNFRMWRTRNIEHGNPYGDGKWRYQMFDTEFALGIYSGGAVTGQSRRNPFDEILNGTDNNHRNNRLFKQLMGNQDFCKQFVITMMDMCNVNFNYNSSIAKLDEMAKIYSPLMLGYDQRWGRSWKSFDAFIGDMKNYLNVMRNTMPNTLLPDYFGSIGISSGNLRNVTLSAKCNGANVSGAAIKINTTTPVLSNGSWTGRYYSALPVTVTANVPNGYAFSGWTVTGGSAENPSSQTTVVNFTGNAAITANYSR